MFIRDNIVSMWWQGFVALRTRYGIEWSQCNLDSRGPYWFINGRLQKKRIYMHKSMMTAIHFEDIPIVPQKPVTKTKPGQTTVSATSETPSPKTIGPKKCSYCPNSLSGPCLYQFPIVRSDEQKKYIFKGNLVFCTKECLLAYYNSIIGTRPHIELIKRYIYDVSGSPI